MSTVLVISDLHVPFTHPKYLDFIRRIKKNYKPDETVFIGDIMDFYAFSRYDQDPDSLSPGDELKKAKEALKPWFNLFPKAYACIGNHDVRLSKKAVRAGIPVAAFKPFNELLGCPDGWEWQDSWDIDGVQYIHGDAFGGKYAHVRAAETHRMSTVVGHSHHSAGIVYLDGAKGLIFGANVGCGIDTDAYAFAYARKNPYKPVLACGIIRDGKYPQVIPMI
jgi:predicted phosphodiesterase